MNEKQNRTPVVVLAELVYKTIMANMDVSQDKEEEVAGIVTQNVMDTVDDGSQTSKDI